MLSLLVVVGLLIAWFVTAGGGGTQHKADGPDGKNPAPSITPGPSGSGPAISQHPGGRDEASNGGTSGGATSSGGSPGATGGDDGSSGTAGGDQAGGDQAGGDSGAGVPAGSSMPTCAPSAVKFSLRAVPNSYGPGESPHIRLTAKNTSGTDCKIDLGPEHTVLTITRTDGDKQLWASDDCPQTSGSQFLRVPAGDSITHTITWNRKPSSPDCATPPATPAPHGTYLVEAQTPGFPKAQSSFVLTED